MSSPWQSSPSQPFRIFDIASRNHRSRDNQDFSPEAKQSRRLIEPAALFQIV
jgi:hypothetical protein